jgi:hypothetical protein
VFGKFGVGDFRQILGESRDDLSLEFTRQSRFKVGERSAWRYQHQRVTRRSLSIAVQLLSDVMRKVTLGPIMGILAGLNAMSCRRRAFLDARWWRVADVMRTVVHVFGLELPDCAKVLTLGRANKASATAIGNHIKGIYSVHPASPFKKTRGLLPPSSRLSRQCGFDRLQRERHTDH